MPASRGFQEIPHTADWAMKVWAEDLPSLLVTAANGMNALAGIRIESAPRVEQSLQLEAPDDETLLVQFLSELLYLQEQERLAFDSIDLSIDDHRLSARMQGGAVADLAKQIKAVTFHNLRIIRTPSGCETEIVFDV
jgi:SHS2 domain-containing protein